MQGWEFEHKNVNGFSDQYLSIDGNPLSGIDKYKRGSYHVGIAYFIYSQQKERMNSRIQEEQMK